MGLETGLSGEERCLLLLDLLMENDLMSVNNYYFLRCEVFEEFDWEVLDGSLCVHQLMMVVYEYMCWFETALNTTSSDFIEWYQSVYCYDNRMAEADVYFYWLPDGATRNDR